VTLPINADVLRGCYNFLNETEPFRRWNLPDGEDVRFVVTRSRSNAGRHWTENDKHIIEISGALLGHTHSLIEIMAHEMVHAHERRNKGASSCGEHGASFKRWAGAVCRYHGFDPKYF
jgi:SprT-like family